jgi:hypothetical protein
VRGGISEHRKERYSVLESASADERDFQSVLEVHFILLRAVFDFDFSTGGVTEVDWLRGTVFEIEYDIGYHRDGSERRDDEVDYITVKLVVKTVVGSLNLEHVPQMVVSSQKKTPEM